VGGYVYRGTEVPSLVGSYVFTDFYQKPIWALSRDPRTGNVTRTVVSEQLGGYLSAFGESATGELFALLYAPGSRGQIHALRAAAPPVSDTFPATLSATGCADPLNPERALPGMFPYSVNAPFWSDGAEKRRWFAIPDGTTVSVQRDGDWAFPAGSVVRKDFVVDGRLLETRLMVRHSDGDWAGYTYRWRDDGSDADLLPASATAPRAAGDRWYFPDRGECLTCHTAAAGRTLGPESAQMDRTVAWDNGAVSNQLETFDHIGLLSGAVPAPGDAAALADPTDGLATTERQARSWLHTNCASCHRPSGGTPASIDLRVTTPLSGTRACDVVPSLGDLGITGARLVAPGDPARSVLLQRMGRRDVHGMPPLGSVRVDDAGVTLVSRWIAALSGCTE
jgi:uncharacterized repeat protein (TIGR03806 family)